MPREVFADAGAWIAVMAPRDAYHEVATSEYRRLLREPVTLVTTNLVVAEAHAIVQRSSGHGPAMQFLRSIRQSSRVLKIHSTAELEAEAEIILARYADQRFSLADAVSFAVMRQRKIGEAFGFDHHFLTAGFALIPAPT